MMVICLPAQPNFYAGKQITIIVSSAPGGGYDAITRTVGRHLGNGVLMDLLAPRTLLPVDPATALLAEGGDPVQIAAQHPTSSAAWAALADEALGRGFSVEAYAYARTGYHRGLDQLRRSGWKGHGPVPWEHEPNRGFLRALHALARAAQAIGEQEEYTRCSQFLKDSSPTAAQTLG